jgi:hypothetical protein
MIKGFHVRAASASIVAGDRCRCFMPGKRQTCQSRQASARAALLLLHNFYLRQTSCIHLYFVSRLSSQADEAGSATGSAIRCNDDDYIHIYKDDAPLELTPWR